MIRSAWMDQRTRALVISALVGVFALGALGWLWTAIEPLYTNEWHAPEQLNFWVAVGTLALAGVTTWNVRITRSVVSAEDRRHRQSLAPIVEMNLLHESDRAYVFTLRNLGLGPATNVRVLSKAEWFSGSTPQREERFTLSVSVIASGDKVNPLGRGYDGLFFSDGQVTLQDVRIFYADMFGNGYETRYATAGLERYEWLRPTRLH